LGRSFDEEVDVGSSMGRVGVEEEGGRVSMDEIGVRAMK
jgi:hypothetical protein